MAWSSTENLTTLSHFFLGRCKNMEQKYGDGGWQPFALEIGVIALEFEGCESWRPAGFSADIGLPSLFAFWV